MTKSFFSLNCGNKNKVVANRHIIPAKEAVKLLNGSEMLKLVLADVEQYKIENAKEIEKQKELAIAEGFAEGYQKWTSLIANLELEVKKVAEDMQQQLIPVALKAAKKIVGKEIEVSNDIIVDIVANVLKSVSQCKKITIYVNKKDLEVLELGRSKLKAIFETLEILSLRERADIIRGGCIIETESGIINAQLENQWSALERAFTSLAASKNKDL